MAGAVDDFSLLVTLKSPEDLLLRPLYHSQLNPEHSKLAEVLAPYHFDKPYPCGLSSCRTPHQSGYLVVTEDEKETNIGGICGRRIFGEDFSIKANLQEKRFRLKHQLDTLQRVRNQRDELLQRIGALFNADIGVKWAEASRRAFKDAVGHDIYKKLQEKARRNESGVEHVRSSTQEERERHRAANPTGKPLQFVTEKLGDLIGLDFLNHYPEKLLTDIKDKVYGLETLDAKALSPKARKEWVDWATGIERRLEEIERILTDAVRFFAQSNFALIVALGRDKKEQQKLTSVRWSASERRVVTRALK